MYQALTLVIEVYSGPPGRGGSSSAGSGCRRKYAMDCAAVIMAWVSFRDLARLRCSAASWTEDALERELPSDGQDLSEWAAGLVARLWPRR